MVVTCSVRVKYLIIPDNSSHTQIWFRVWLKTYSPSLNVQTSVRNAIRKLKQIVPEVIVAEFNFQSDFRDRTSSLESLMSVVQRMPSCKVIVFYETEFAHQLQRLTSQHPVFATLTFPIDETSLRQALAEAAATPD